MTVVLGAQELTLHDPVRAAAHAHLLDARTDPVTLRAAAPLAQEVV